MAEDLAPGTSIGGYRVESLLGRGGMGVVYLAEHVTLGRRAALKVISPELAADPSFRARFLREARLAASLDHPNIIPVFDAGKLDDVFFLAMKYVPGTDLATVLRDERRLTAERSLDVLSKVADALDEAHRHGLVHRDVKPGNILLSTKNQIYLTDFGLAKGQDSASRLTKTGYVMGTLDYMAPEVLRGQEADARTDVYALACVLFECLTGSVPYPRDLDAAIISAHLMDPAPSIGVMRPDMPPELDDVVSRGMEKEPEQRIATCGELLASASAAIRGAARRTHHRRRSSCPDATRSRLSPESNRTSLSLAPERKRPHRPRRDGTTDAGTSSWQRSSSELSSWAPGCSRY